MRVCKDFFIMAAMRSNTDQIEEHPTLIEALEWQHELATRLRSQATKQRKFVDEFMTTPLRHEGNQQLVQKSAGVQPRSNLP
jgi:hypothetical protein